MPAGFARPRTVVDDLPANAKVVVFRALPGLGDFLCVVPALRALRRAHPDAHVSFVGLEAARPLVARCSDYVDEFIEFPGFPGLPERRPAIRRWPAFLEAIQERGFDLALQFHGNGGVTNRIVALFGARRTAGVFVPGEFCPDPSRFAADRGPEPEVRRWLRVLNLLGIPATDAALEFPMAPDDEDVPSGLEDAGLAPDEPFVCVHAGAQEAGRRWRPSAFATVADGVAVRGYRVVLTGTPAEAATTSAVSRAMRAPAIDLTGRTTLPGLAKVLRRSSLLIANDTGVAHLADALRVPSVVVFTGSDPRRWAALDTDLHRAVGPDPRLALTQAVRLLRSRETHAA